MKSCLSIVTPLFPHPPRLIKSQFQSFIPGESTLFPAARSSRVATLPGENAKCDPPRAISHGEDEKKKRKKGKKKPKKKKKKRKMKEKREKEEISRRKKKGLRTTSV